MTPEERKDAKDESKSYSKQACSRCRQQRKKCDGDGTNPCTGCSSKSYTCSYSTVDGLGDRRKIRSTAVELEELRSTKTVFNALCDAVRDGRAELLLERIRDGARVSELLQVLGEIDNDPDPFLSDTMNMDNNDNSITQPQSSMGHQRQQSTMSAMYDEEASVNMARLPSSKLDSNQAQQDPTSATLRQPSLGVTVNPDRITWHHTVQLRHQDGDAFLGREYFRRPADFVLPTRADAPVSILLQNSSRSISRRTSPDHQTTKESMAQGESNSLPVHQHEVQLLQRLQLTRSYPSPGYVRTFGNLPFSSSVVANGYPQMVQSQQIWNFTRPDYLILPLLEADGTPLARVCTDFQRFGQDMIARGVPVAEVIGDETIDAELYFRDRTPNDPYTPATWASETARAFIGVFDHTVNLAGLIHTARLMRWLIYPDRDTYAMVPERIRPTKSQRIFPHSPVVDLNPFAAVRDALVRKMRDVVNIQVSAGLTVSWPYTVNEAVVFNPTSGRLQIAPAFIEHVDNIRNWKLGKGAFAEFPDIKRDINLDEHDIPRFSDRFLK